MAASETILSVKDLRVRFRTLDGAVEAVKGISIHVNAGETVAVVGESGSGKSQTMMAAMSLLASNGEATGSVDYRGRNLLTLSKSELNQVRGRKISMIFQEPMTSLDPLYSIGNQLIEPIRRHRGLNAAEAREEALKLLRLVHIPDPERRMKSYPHEMSGGQRQRVMIAMALANDPDILIADEPTTALDVTIQAQILMLLAELQRKLGMAIVFITHDLGIVRRFADRVYVMRQGEVVEEGEAEAIFVNPQHAYTKMLLAAEPAGSKRPPPANAPVLLEGRNVEVTFRIGGGFLAGEPLMLRAVDHISIRLQRNQTIGIVGESGSGKSTLGRALLRLLPSDGLIRFGDRDISQADRQAMRPLRRQMQLVFQDPFGSLSPRMTVGQVITEGLLVHEPDLSGKQRDQRAVDALREVGLDPNARNRYPHEFSGGQRQRIAIARAMILKPRLVVLDEPTSALDRSVQKQIVELLRKLQADHELSYLFISHDLSVVRAMADYIIVMKQGKIVEEGPTEAIFSDPRHAYTQTLMAAAIDVTRFRLSA
ncbi:ABC transporter ATP-binding protein [Mesorhizobium sp. M7A.F.Ca.CA.001.07.2.1]|uniref:ABC transporter ATP-binding protein n=9 Tax=Phyllobacteriaceae TaxID=69277 RepID=UPI000FCAA1B1|nr:MULTISPECIES: ABC transporter ATP-binding protein [Mesorhizobium]MCF6122867.1 ABC transporter ATP-binding protein [Mesorhizobium ciceri]MCQ8813331.1 ABC transporter ATP-binding protein [Mesorhizobium sp. SEMIA396]RUX89317.1 ABC transporter ATP-binding protein [Mesorhizobium sp. M7A.F.Ca.CA.004.08.1.1]RUY03722.1 ABC transporter ATP-binding protein [Mesorhizobium sp. M7A.F.Ca.CA.004.04.1.1]RUY53672.1 ABC transporter ATP-binding protein [Mesorhizobium sp. M7A.F.Ca.CA.001.12.1.1]